MDLVQSGAMSSEPAAATTSRGYTKIKDIGSGASSLFCTSRLGRLATSLPRKAAMAKRFLYRTRSDSHATPSLFEVWVTLHVPKDKESKLYVMKIIDMSRMDPKQRKDPTMQTSGN